MGRHVGGGERNDRATFAPIAGVALALSVLGCGGPVADVVDGASVDAASSDAGVADDAAAPERPPGAPTLHPQCGVRSYDLARAETYDTREELAVAIFEAECARSVRRADCLFGAECDPESPVRALPGRLHAPIDVTQAHACLAALDTDDCALWMDVPACAPLRVDRAPTGAPCERDATCASGLCVGDATAACGGTCTAPRTCASCAATEACDPRTGTCVARRALGECCNVCVDGPAPPCVEGAVCFETTCVALLGEGGACGGDDALCEAGLRCGTDGRCGAPHEVGLGDPCDDVLALCPVGTDCSQGGPPRSCIGRAREGQACGDRRCEGGLVCGAAGLCARLVAPGCPCDDTTACPYGLVCAAGTCQPIGAVAPTCARDDECASLPCVEGRCTHRGIGAACSPTEACHDGHCRSGTCVLDLPLGAACTSDPYGCAPSEICMSDRCTTVTGDPCW